MGKVEAMAGVVEIAGVSDKVELESLRKPGGATRDMPLPASSGGAGQAFTGLARILAGHEAELSAYLTGVGTNIDGSTDIAFYRLRTVHFLRWVVLTDVSGTGWLAFESNYDGELHRHLDELLQVGAAAIHEIYRHCTGYPLSESAAIRPSDHEAVVSFMRQGALPFAAFHVALHGKTAERIRRESAVALCIEKYADSCRTARQWDGLAPADIYQRIVQHLEHEGLLSWARERQPPAPASSDFLWALRVVPVALVLLPLLIPLLIHELFDGEDTPAAEPPGIKELAEREDFKVQNQLTHLVELRPGPLRRLALRVVLFTIDLLARYKFNQGALGGITTIHFARWVLIDGGKRLLFFSNYDGSWENYLGDFIDKAHAGLTGVWSNTKGFPKTRFLILGGATDEERFKSWTRTHQVPTQLWYSAYPELTVFNIQQNAKICAGLAGQPPTPETMLAWLQFL